MAKPPLRYLVNCAILFDVPIEVLLEPDALEWSRIGAATPPAPPPMDGRRHRSRARLTDASGS